MITRASTATHPSGPQMTGFASSASRCSPRSCASHDSATTAFPRASTSAWGWPRTPSSSRRLRGDVASDAGAPTYTAFSTSPQAASDRERARSAATAVPGEPRDPGCEGVRSGGRRSGSPRSRCGSRRMDPVTTELRPGYRATDLPAATADDDPTTGDARRDGRLHPRPRPIDRCAVAETPMTRTDRWYITRLRVFADQRPAIMPAPHSARTLLCKQNARSIAAHVVGLSSRGRTPCELSLWPSRSWSRSERFGRKSRPGVCHRLAPGGTVKRGDAVRGESRTSPRRHHVRGRQARAGRKPRRSEVVGEGGVEPPRPCGHRNLNPARLPIPPLARGERIVAVVPPGSPSRFRARRAG